MELKKIISYIFSFFLSFFIFLLTLLCVVRFTLAQESYFYAKLESTQYYESAVTDFNRILKQNARPTNFPVELFDDIVVVSEVSDGMKAFVEASFDGETGVIDTQSFKVKLEEKTSTYIEENAIQVDEKTQEAIDTFINANVENYEKLLQFPYITYYAQFVNLYHTVFNIAALVLVGLCIVLAWGQVRMHKSKRRKKRWISYSFIGSGLLSTIFPLYLIASKTLDRIQLAPEYLYDMLVSSLYGVLYIMIIIGFIFIVIGVLLTYLKIKKKTSKKGRDYSKSVMLDAIHR